MTPKLRELNSTQSSSKAGRRLSWTNGRLLGLGVGSRQVGVPVAALGVTGEIGMHRGCPVWAAAVCGQRSCRPLCGPWCPWASLASSAQQPCQRVSVTSPTVQTRTRRHRTLGHRPAARNPSWQDSWSPVLSREPASFPRCPVTLGRVLLGCARRHSPARATPPAGGAGVFPA